MNAEFLLRFALLWLAVDLGLLLVFSEIRRRRGGRPGPGGGRATRSQIARPASSWLTPAAMTPR